MTDDHDRCEWVNVSSGTGSPGLDLTESNDRLLTPSHSETTDQLQALQSFEGVPLILRVVNQIESNQVL